MSLRELVDAECSGANPLMRLGNHLVHDAAHKDDGISGIPGTVHSAPDFASQPINDANLVNEFLGQMSAPPPQSFRMDELLQEMREIDARNHPGQVIRAPAIADEIHKSATWSGEFHSVQEQNTMITQQMPMQSVAAMQGAMTKDFFDEPVAGPSLAGVMAPPPLFMNRMNYAQPPISGYQTTEERNEWSDAYDAIGLNENEPNTSDWLKDFEEHKATEDAKNDEFNKHFWNNLKDEWKKRSQESEEQSPWLSEFSEFYDPYKVFSILSKYLCVHCVIVYVYQRKFKLFFILF